MKISVYEKLDHFLNQSMAVSMILTVEVLYSVYEFILEIRHGIFRNLESSNFTKNL